MTRQRVRLASHREIQWLYRDPALGLQRGLGTGNEGAAGVWSDPIALQGGDVVLVQDVDVPAIGAGNTADWTITYPGLGGGPIYNLPLLDYDRPPTTDSKLNGKISFSIVDVEVYFGLALCGALPPKATTIGATIDFTLQIEIKTPSIFVPYRVSGSVAGGWAIPDEGPLSQLFPNVTKKPNVPMGGDIGKTRCQMFLTNNLGTGTDAGRLRVVLRGHEL